MNYFNQCSTVEDIKKLYRELAMANHPDRGGDTATMQEINAQYQQALKGQHETTSVGSDGKKHTYYYNYDKEQEIIDFIDQLIRSGALKPDVECWLIGRWVWIRGNTKPVKDILKDLSCRWHSKRQCWYWHNQEYRSRYSRASFGELAMRYGAREIVGQDENSTANMAKAA